MDVENLLVDQTISEKMTISSEIDNIIRFLVVNEEIIFKSQQRGETEPDESEKTQIAFDLYNKSKLNFLMKFGKYLKLDQLPYFEKYTEKSEPGWEEIKIVLKDLGRTISIDCKQLKVKNRRYEALQKLIKENSYFSEIEMMKRNPLLYEQLIGQYLTDEEKRDRDKFVMGDDATLVKILMEGIERDNAEFSRKCQQQKEDDQMEESDTSDEDEAYASSKPTTVRWGEFEEHNMATTKSKKRAPAVTAEERLLLKEEFISTMYQSFLDGKDEDFDYSSVDDSCTYDNVSEMEHDAEDKYFDSEEAEERIDSQAVESSEDELDIYMNALNQHPAVCELAKSMNKM